MCCKYFPFRLQNLTTMQTPKIVYQWARSYIATDGGTITWPERLKMAWAEYKASKPKRKRCKVRAMATYVTKVSSAKPQHPIERVRERFYIRANGAFYQCKPRPQRRRKGKLSNKHVERAIQKEHEVRTRIYSSQ